MHFVDFPCLFSGKDEYGIDTSAYGPEEKKIRQLTLKKIELKAQIAKLKKAHRLRLAAVETRSLQDFRAVMILTNNCQARLHWLFGLGDLETRIPLETRIQIGDIIDAAYEKWRNEGDEAHQSGESTDFDSESERDNDYVLPARDEDRIVTVGDPLDCYIDE